MVNGRVAKPSSEVKAGDIISLRVGAKETSYEILDIGANVKANEAKNLYRVVE
jgi:ribosomal 50S subunit-recycling heat shock protein